MGKDMLIWHKTPTANTPYCHQFSKQAIGELQAKLYSARELPILLQQPI